MQKLVKLVSVSLFAVGAVVACSSGGGGAQDSGTNDANTVDTGKKPPEAGTNDASDAGVCTATATYGNTVTSQEASYMPTPADAGADAGPQDAYYYDGQLNTDIDFIDLELYDGYGVFAGGVKPGTYQLTGNELNYGTCGLCALIFTDGTAIDSATDAYMATGGTVTITTVTPTLAGTITNVSFTHVSVDQNTLESTPIGDGCNSTIATLDFTANVTTQ